MWQHARGQRGRLGVVQQVSDKEGGYADNILELHYTQWVIHTDVHIVVSFISI